MALKDLARKASRKEGRREGKQDFIKWRFERQIGSWISSLRVEKAILHKTISYVQIFAGPGEI